ncbi:hypothetical protein DPMN_052216 [Dreissena polymorpha]|uniref:Uncharacterized protein n=1 Tax=Dreissena polymorpha TaxID=45954 RepID=A0A9D4HP41_DREPO|nr:hypothetical protein DPMN_052216 [Dreissena polymorpha]
MMTDTIKRGAKIYENQSADVETEEKRDDDESVDQKEDENEKSDAHVDIGECENEDNERKGCSDCMWQQRRYRVCKCRGLR